MRELKIGTSWVRGVVGDALTPELAVNFAISLGTWGGGGPIVIGRDTRRSSNMLRAAVISGLMAPGCEVIDLGICPTPLVSFAVRELGAVGGISITGSHNDARWNALKFIGPDGTLFTAVKSLELLDIYHAAAFTISPNGPYRVTESADVLDRFLEHMLTSLNVDSIRSQKFRVAIDFCNGSCATVMTRFCEALGCTVLPLNDSPSSDFAHAPAPSIANMKGLTEFVQDTQADLGAALNVDGDRIAFVASDGTPLSEEYTLPLAAQSRLRRRPGPVVTNFSTSRLIDVVAGRFGQSVVRTAVGEGYVMDRGLQEGAVLAGEGSGGVGVLPLTMTFDAASTLGSVLDYMATGGETLLGFVESLPQFFNEKGEIKCSADQVYRLLEVFREEFRDLSPDMTDGLRVEWSDAWLHVRASNTEPLLRVIVEAQTEQRATTLFNSAMTLAQRAVAKGKGEQPA